MNIIIYTPVHIKENRDVSEFKQRVKEQLESYGMNAVEVYVDQRKLKEYKQEDFAEFRELVNQHREKVSDILIIKVQPRYIIHGENVSVELGMMDMLFESVSICDPENFEELVNAVTI